MMLKIKEKIKVGYVPSVHHCHVHLKILYSHVTRSPVGVTFEIQPFFPNILRVKVITRLNLIDLITSKY